MKTGIPYSQRNLHEKKNNRKFAIHESVSGINQLINQLDQLREIGRREDVTSLLIHPWRKIGGRFWRK